MTNSEITIERVLALLGRATIDVMDRDRRIAELEQALQRVNAEKAQLIAIAQNEIETVRMERVQV